MKRDSQDRKDFRKLYIRLQNCQLLCCPNTKIKLCEPVTSTVFCDVWNTAPLPEGGT